MSADLAADAPLPWQAEQWARIAAQLEAGRVPHALLLTGPPGVGKWRFATALAATLLCQAPSAGPRACGGCRSCRLFAAGSHPDWLQVAPDEPNSPIKVDAVRDLTARLVITAQQGQRRVATLRPAEAMNINAANSLLKTLEEPAAGRVLVLISDQPGRLPATVRSRCQRIAFPAPERHRALEWLADAGAPEAVETALDLVGGAPLAARELLVTEGALDARRAFVEDWGRVATGQADPLEVAARWQGEDLKTLMDCAATVVMEAIRRRAGGDSAGRLAGPVVQGPMQWLARGPGWAALHSHLDRILDAGRLAGHPVNAQLLLEGLLIDLARRNAPEER